MAPGIDEKNMIFAPKNVCFPPYFPASMVFRGKLKNPKSRVEGWSTARVRWCTGSDGLNTWSQDHATNLLAVF